LAGVEAKAGPTPSAGARSDERDPQGIIERLMRIDENVQLLLYGDEDCGEEED
jgi:hypothetical protein